MSICIPFIANHFDVKAITHLCGWVVVQNRIFVESHSESAISNHLNASTRITLLKQSPLIIIFKSQQHSISNWVYFKLNSVSFLFQMFLMRNIQKFVEGRAFSCFIIPALVAILHKGRLLYGRKTKARGVY